MNITDEYLQLLHKFIMKIQIKRKHIKMTNDIIKSSEKTPHITNKKMIILISLFRIKQI